MTRLILLLVCISLIALGRFGAVFAQTTAVIANHGDDEIIRIFTEDESAETADLSGTPYGVAVTPDGFQALVTLEDENQLAFVNLNDFTQTPFLLPVENSPRGVAVDPSGAFAYVGNYEEDTVTEIRLIGQTVVDTYDVGDGPLGVAASYDEAEENPVVYVANHLEDSISVIDGQKEVTVINVGNGPSGVAISPDGKHLYVAVTDDDELAVVDTEDNEIVETVSVGDEPWGVAVGAEGEYVYVTNSGDDTVTVVSGSDFSVVRTFGVGDTPRGVAAPRNGSFAYVVNQSAGTISKIDMDDNSVTDVVQSAFSNAYSLGTFIGGVPPNPPGGLQLEAAAEDEINLNWTDNSDDEEGFKIERSKENEEAYTQIAVVDPDTTTYQDNGLASETVYFYRIRSYNEAADSNYGASASVETEPYSGSVWCFIKSVFGE